MTKQALLAVLVITASVPSFRRAGHGFTDRGTAYPKEHFTDDQLKAIYAEKKLSVREMSSDAIPEGVERTLVDAALANATTEENASSKAAAAKTASTTAKAGTKASKETGAGNAGA